MLESLSHIMVFVTDFDRALQWYCEMLGFTKRHVAPGAYASLWHAGMGCRLDLHPTETTIPTGAVPMPYFVTSDLDGTVAELRKLGVDVGRIESEGEGDHVVRFVNMTDSEGNVLGIEESR